MFSTIFAADPRIGFTSASSATGGGGNLTGSSTAPSPLRRAGTSFTTGTAATGRASAAATNDWLGR